MQYAIYIITILFLVYQLRLEISKTGVVYTKNYKYGNCAKSQKMYISYNKLLRTNNTSTSPEMQFSIIIIMIHIS